MFMGIAIISFCMFVAIGVLISCVSYRKGMNEQKKIYEQLHNSNEYEMSQKEFDDFCKDYIEKFYNDEKDNEEKDFLTFVQDYLNGKKDDRNLVFNTDGTVKVFKECEGYECICSPNREDCCNGKQMDGKFGCSVYLNINKICGVEDIVRNKDLLTPREIDMLADILSKNTDY